MLLSKPTAMRKLTPFRKSFLNRLPTLVAAISAAAALAPGNAKAISFVLNDVTPGGMSMEALAGFNQAVDIWESKIADAITFNLDISFTTLGAGILGSTGSNTIGASYTNVRTALTTKATSANDAVAVAGLPIGTSLSFVTNNATTSARFTDNNDTGNNNTLDVNTANAKALGLLAANAPGTDASIGFSDAFSWDFDQSDGVDAGKQDFVGVTVHEIGHALGFVSGVDTVDATHGDGVDAGTSLENFRVFSVHDLYRYGSPGVLDYATGGTPYFSIDGGTTSLATMSTGSANGDGRQASHWKDNFGIGIMDPTANPPGNVNTLSALDLVAFDVIGYELVPEPTSALLGAIGLMFIVSRRRK